MRLARRTPSEKSATRSVGVVLPPARPAAPGLEEHYRAFYERMQPRAQDFAERFASRVEAEDAVQDAMMDLWLTWVRRGAEPLTDRFFLAIVRHKVIDQRRTSRRMVSLEDAEDSLEAVAFRAQSHLRPTRGDAPDEVLDLAVAALPPKRREVFLLAQEHEYTYKEVSTALRVSENTVKTHLRLATADIRATFEAAGYQYAPAGRARLRAPASPDSQDDPGAPDHD